MLCYAQKVNVGLCEALQPVIHYKLLIINY